MSARRQIIAALSEDSYGGIATLEDVARAEQLVDAHRAEVLAEIANPADAATIYAVRPCVCDETPHPTWCPASVPTDERITEIRQGIGEPLTARELFWLKGAAGRHELHVTGSRGGHWPLTDDLPGALLLVSQYLAAAVAVIERADLVEEKDTAAATAPRPTPALAELHSIVRAARREWMRSPADLDGYTNRLYLAIRAEVLAEQEKATATAATATPEFFQVGRTYTDTEHGTDWKFRVDHITTHPDNGERAALGWRYFRGEWEPYAYFEDDWDVRLAVDHTDITRKDVRP